ncbi:hypothetical protein D3C85_1546770 [compost metagenome]
MVPPEVRAVERPVDVPPGRTDIVARREVLAGAPQDDDFHRIVVDRLAKGRVQGIGHLRVLRVVESGTIHGHAGDAMLDAVKHRLTRLVHGGIFPCHELVVSGTPHARSPSVAGERRPGPRLA